MRRCGACQTENAEDAAYCVECGVSLAVPQPGDPDPLLGKVLQDRYRIDRLLGEGAASRVYLATQAIGHGSREVALKVLRPGAMAGTDTARLVRRFYRECDTVVRLSHPHTIRFYDFGELPGGIVFIAMEYIAGSVPLSQVGRLSVERITSIISQIAEALQEAHDHGIVHRDLKPDNILLTNRHGSRDFVTVLDFGIAKRVAGADDEEMLTQRGVILGTPPYMSPEQFQDVPIDARADTYSLAVVAYELLTGALPFYADSPWEWAAQHMTVAPAPFEAHADGARVPETVRRAIFRALSKKPAERQATVLQFAEELSAPATPSTERMSIVPPTSLLPENQRTAGRKRRGWIGWALASLVLAAAVSLGVAYALGHIRIPSDPPPLPRLTDAPR